MANPKWPTPNGSQTTRSHRTFTSTPSQYLFKHGIDGLINCFDRGITIFKHFKNEPRSKKGSLFDPARVPLIQLLSPNHFAHHQAHYYGNTLFLE
jgi:hypothetical protein